MLLFDTFAGPGCRGSGREGRRRKKERAAGPGQLLQPEPAAPGRNAPVDVASRLSRDPPPEMACRRRSHGPQRNHLSATRQPRDSRDCPRLPVRRGGCRAAAGRVSAGAALAQRYLVLDLCHMAEHDLPPRNLLRPPACSTPTSPPSATTSRCRNRAATGPGHGGARRRRADSPHRRRVQPHHPQPHRLRGSRRLTAGSGCPGTAGFAHGAARQSVTASRQPAADGRAACPALAKPWPHAAEWPRQSSPLSNRISEPESVTVAWCCAQNSPAGSPAMASDAVLESGGGYGPPIRHSTSHVPAARLMRSTCEQRRNAAWSVSTRSAGVSAAGRGPAPARAGSGPPARTGCRPAPGSRCPGRAAAAPLPGSRGGMSRCRAGRRAATSGRC